MGTFKACLNLHSVDELQTWLFGVVLRLLGVLETFCTVR